MAENNISNNFQEKFLDELVKQAGFEAEDSDLIKDDLRPILQERTMLSIYRELTDEQIDKVWEYMEHEQYDELTKFLKWIIPNFDDFINEVYAQFEDEYLEGFQED